MYEAKASGKSQYRVFEPTMHQQVTERLDIESELRRALQRNEIFLHYQPIVEVCSGTLVGFEALARWNHSRLGMVPPSQFIPIAEETGLIVPIGQAVLEMACRQLRDWNSKHAKSKTWSMSVNLSSKQLTQDGLVEMIQQTRDHERSRTWNPLADWPARTWSPCSNRRLWYWLFIIGGASLASVGCVENRPVLRR